MENLYHHTQRLILDLQNLLPRAERSYGKDAQDVEGNMLAFLEEVTSNIQQLDVLVNKELPVRRREARLRVDQLKQERLLLQNGISEVQRRRMQREHEEAAREELMTMTFRPNNQDMALNIDHALEHNTSLNRINSSLDDIWETGSAILDGMRSQRNVLKSAHRRLLDVTSVMSLSNTVMRMIERRSTQDKYLFYGCAVLTCLVIAGSFWYFRH